MHRGTAAQRRQERRQSEEDIVQRSVNARRSTSKRADRTARLAGEHGGSCAYLYRAPENNTDSFDVPAVPERCRPKPVTRIELQSKEVSGVLGIACWRVANGLGLTRADENLRRFVSGVCESAHGGMAAGNHRTQLRLGGRCGCYVVVHRLPNIN